jgi:hypothetical protein
VLLEMQEDVANRCILEMLLPVLIASRRIRGRGVSRSCPGHVEIAIDETGRDLLNPLGMEDLDPEAFVMGTTQVEEHLDPYLAYRHVQLLTLNLAEFVDGCR